MASQSLALNDKSRVSRIPVILRSDGPKSVGTAGAPNALARSVRPTYVATNGESTNAGKRNVWPLSVRSAATSTWRFPVELVAGSCPCEGNPVVSCADAAIAISDGASAALTATRNVFTQASDQVD